MKKAMMATWSESEESSEEEKEKKWQTCWVLKTHDRDESKFAFLTKRKGGYVTFGDNAKGRIIGQDNLGKFDAKSDVGIFLGYSTSSKAFRVFNKRTMVVEESIHVIFDESNNSLQERESFDDDLGLETSMGKLQIEDKRQQEESGEDPKKEESPLALPPPQQVQGESSQDLPKDWKFVINHPQDQIIGNPSSGCMHSEFEMSMMGELNFFLGLQIKQLKEGTFINQAKYIKDLLKRFNMEEAKGDNFELIGFSDADFAGCRVERKSTSGTCHFLGHSLVSWHSKKQNSVALSTAEAEYIAAGFGFDEILRLGFHFDGFGLGSGQFLRVCAIFVFLLLSAHLGFLRLVFSTFEFETGASRGQGKRPAEPSQQPERTEARRKARYDTALFGSVEDYQRYKTHFAKRKVVPGRNINFFQLQGFGFEELFTRMGWLPVVTVYEPIFPTLVRAFYFEIELSPESICRILDIPPVGLRVYEAKAWPTIPGFEPREAIRVLHHMICSILLPRGGHRDEVSYYEAFLVDSLLTGRRIHVGYVMMRHMMSCCESTTRVLPYDRFLTRVFKDVGIDLSVETEFEAPSIYDTYDEHSLGRMKLEKAPDGSWIRKAERQARGHDQLHPGVEEEDEIREMEDGLDLEGP
ncbi:hypothetical protein AAG906_007933 [Vitis piasezkii]